MPAVTSSPKPTLETVLSEAAGAQDCDAVVPVFTLIVWSVCLGVGVLGLVLPYAHPSAPPKAPAPVRVQALQVELQVEPQSTPADKPLAEPMPLPQADLAPAALAVAEPSPTIAFAIPVAGPVRVGQLSQAGSSQTGLAAPSTSAVHALTLGVGDGKQPPPLYPRRALQEHQQGSVTVRFVVGADGLVSSAEATEPCAWPLLNAAALRTIREQWRFPAGDLRVYEVAIRFQLTD